MSVFALAIASNSRIFSFASVPNCPSQVRQTFESILSRITFTYNLNFTENHFGLSYHFVIRQNLVYFCISNISCSRDIVKRCLQEMTNYIIRNELELNTFLNEVLSQINDPKLKDLSVEVMNENIQDAMRRGNIVDITNDLPSQSRLFENSSLNLRRQHKRRKIIIPIVVICLAILLLGTTFFFIYI